MRNIITIMLLTIAVASFAQSMDWYVIDQGGGMQEFDIGDSIWVSIGQTAIGPASAGAITLGTGYLYVGSTQLDIMQKAERPKTFTINSINPNPFNTACVIEFEISEGCDVAIDLFDMQGRIIGDLADENNLNAGKYRLRWNAENLASGVYFVRLNAGAHTITERVVLMK